MLRAIILKLKYRSCVCVVSAVVRRIQRMLENWFLYLQEHSYVRANFCQQTKVDSLKIPGYKSPAWIECESFSSVH